ncbi:hypothetical protein SMD44_05113 [Streptomyces alboflavus]|uniref:Uncharacterized protein n=1 Tax=Streptomyces alboflavus TaxID=67267 RepID=A0A1Z1WH01_9ACTN|nr:hypothetical protein [Streptomyces alboflavus]ARX85649.1 hypothetical protein SMD44_05113 [Streptomyces alboflavus]
MNRRTHADSRRGLIAAREAGRDARRDRFRLLLARAERGALSAEDCAQLRGDVEAEVAECNAFRRSAGGQQAAAMRLHNRVEAAEQAIVEAEAERDQHAEAVTELAERLAAAGQFARALDAALPGDEWHLADAIRRLCSGEIAPEQALADTAR